MAREPFNGKRSSDLFHIVLLGALCLSPSRVRESRIKQSEFLPPQAQADLGRSAVTTGEASWPTRNVLFEHGLFDEFRAHPESAI